MLVYEEIGRLLLMKYLSKSTDFKEGHVLIDDGETAIGLAQGLLEYVKIKADTCTDKSVVYICRYWLLMNVFKLYYDSQKNGDFVIMEEIENDFCGVFLLMGKSNYYELCLSQMEKRYRDISAAQLNEIRINGSCRYRKDTPDQQYSMHVLDELMENVNCWTKWLPLGSDQNSWVEHSPNVMVARRCLNFVNNEYRRGLIDFEATVNNDDTLQQQDHKYSSYVEPRCNRERSRLYEMLQIQYSDEIPGRVFNNKVSEKVIDSLITSLLIPKINEKKSPIEQTMDNINKLNKSSDMMIDSTINNHPMIDTTTTENDTSEVVNDDGIDDAIDDDTNNYQSTDTTHHNSLIDIIIAGKDKIEGMSIASHRKNVKLMRDCHDNFLRTAFESMVQKMDSNETSQYEEITDHVPSKVSDFLENFNRLKEHDNDQSSFIDSFHHMSNM